MNNTFEPFEESDIDQWDQTSDVIIVGLGCAGASAAIEAKNAGVEVLVLEKASGGGGTTSSAAGHIYAGGGTQVQTAVGIQDSTEAMFQYLLSVTPSPDAEKIKYIAMKV